MKTNENKTKVFTFRVQESLLSQLRELADKNKRSIAKQIEFMLEELLKNNKQADIFSKYIDNLIERKTETRVGALMWSSRQAVGRKLETKQ